VRLLSKASFFAMILAGLVIGCGMASASSASNVYIAQTATGSANGSSCANAYAYTFFNTSGNWGSGANQIGPGTTVHLCGTFTAAAGTSEYLVFQGSGTSGNPVTLLFGSGAVLTATYWSGAVIDFGNHSYATVDGGTNGIIQATSNGTNLANQQNNGVCVAGGHSGALHTNLTVQNLTCSNLYVDASPSDNGGEDTYGLDIWNTSNLVIQNNTLHDMKWAIRNSYQTGSTYSNLTVTGNNIYNMDHGWFGGDSNANGSAVMSNFMIYNNTVGSMVNWDNAADNNHHDWFHLNANSVTTRFTNFYLYDNYGSGDIGVYNTGGFFTYPNAVASESGIYIFNNVFVNTSTSHCWNNGFVSLYQAGAATVVNNTFVSNASSCKDNGLDYNAGSTGLTFENNIMQNSTNADIYLVSGTSVSAMDYNNYYLSPSWYKGGSWYTTLASWRSGSGYDIHSGTANPLLSGTYTLQAGSPAIGAGLNLTSLGIQALDYDKAGIQRPAGSTPWDMGAYQYQSGGPPAPPTGLTATPQ